MAEATHTNCHKCPCPMAIGVQDGFIYWRCMSPVCDSEIKTDVPILGPKCNYEPTRWTLKELILNGAQIRRAAAAAKEG